MALFLNVFLFTAFLLLLGGVIAWVNRTDRREQQRLHVGAAQPTRVPAMRAASAPQPTAEAATPAAEAARSPRSAAA